MGLRRSPLRGLKAPCARATMPVVAARFIFEGWAGIYVIVAEVGGRASGRFVYRPAELDNILDNLTIYGLPKSP